MAALRRSVNVRTTVSATSTRSRASSTHDTPRLEVEREPEVAEWEPDLRQDERRREQGACPEPSASAHERHDRDQPDQELRREHLPERDERAERSRGRAHERFPRSRASRKRQPDPEQRRDLHDRGHDGKDGRSRAGDVLRTVARLAGEPEAEDVVRDEQERGAEALDLQRPAQLDADAVPDTARREDDERQEDRRDDAERKREAGQRLPCVLRASRRTRRRAGRIRPDRSWRSRRGRAARVPYVSGRRRAPRAPPPRSPSARDRSG